MHFVSCLARIYWLFLWGLCCGLLVLIWLQDRVSSARCLAQSRAPLVELMEAMLIHHPQECTQSARASGLNKEVEQPFERASLGIACRFYHQKAYETGTYGVYVVRQSYLCVEDVRAEWEAYARRRTVFHENNRAL